MRWGAAVGEFVNMRIENGYKSARDFFFFFNLGTKLVRNMRFGFILIKR